MEWQIIDVCIDLVWVWTGSTVPQIEGVTWGNGSAVSLKDMTLLFEKVREIIFHHRCNKVLPGVVISMCYLWGCGCQGGGVVWTSQKLLTTCSVTVQHTACTQYKQGSSMHWPTAQKHRHLLIWKGKWRGDQWRTWKRVGLIGGTSLMKQDPGSTAPWSACRGC